MSRIFKANRYVQSVDTYVLEVTQQMNAAIQVQTDEVEEMLLENKVIEHQKLQEEAKAIIRDAEELLKVLWLMLLLKQSKCASKLGRK
ncbi:hypothetical protein [Brevibacillus laterosporus]|uniref:hypothetical protein n=1 Tax=Brevibacillus laterosporus TaxID=1465 RepID=UPI002E1FA4D2|nr:hypothetical protein [Brevibacillus laterosporus]MED1718949.1 hypothetical protein [Brevibacillus laterosporus]